MTAEHRRLEENRTGTAAVARVGTVPQRAPVGHRARGLQRRRRRLGLLPARPGAVARLSLGRGRDRGDQRRASAPVLRARLWNGVDPILKERMFGLTNSEGNHGEDAKDYWFYLDSTPTHSYLKSLYKYPQREFPYDDLVATNGRRSRDEFEYELHRHRDLRRGSLLRRVRRVRQGRARRHPRRGDRAQPRSRRGDPALLPTLWFRNTWAWSPGGEAPSPRARGNDRRRHRRARVTSRARASGCCPATTPRSCCSARTRRTTRACSARRTSPAT